MGKLIVHHMQPDLLGGPTLHANLKGRRTATWLILVYLILLCI